MDSILFLPDLYPSHAHDTFYNGCLELFGEDHVYDFPIREKNHSDYSMAQYKHLYNWWCFNNNHNKLSLSLEHWAKKINDNEIKYIVGTNRACDIFIELIKQIHNKNCCIVLIEEEADPGFEQHRCLIEKMKDYYHKIDIHYKMDYIKNRVCNYDKIYPFYMSGPLNRIMVEVNGRIKPFSERQYDVCYIAGTSHPNRKVYNDILIRDLKYGNNIIMYGNHQLSLNKYFNIINDSKIFISVRGNEWSNTRNIEGPLLGAALFTEILEISLPFDYIDDQSAIFYNKNNLIYKLNNILNDIGRLNRLAAASHGHAMKHHTTLARAEQMITLAKKVKNW